MRTSMVSSPLISSLAMAPPVALATAAAAAADSASARTSSLASV